MPFPTQPTAPIPAVFCSTAGSLLLFQIRRGRGDKTRGKRPDDDTADGVYRYIRAFHIVEILFGIDIRRKIVVGVNLHPTDNKVVRPVFRVLETTYLLPVRAVDGIFGIAYLDRQPQKFGTVDTPL